MSIKALPVDTRHLLGSTSLVTTPVSLAKELLDNAIDAGATSIEVLLSPNTVDKVEVRDNGHGIAAADFEALGRRGHTSKLRQLKDLRTVGSASLGFRGEGLASANTLGHVTITTRTADESVASTFGLIPGLGGVSSGSRKPASAPVGTIVSVACLFAALPVRRKVAVQEATKTVAMIKTLLCGYALARPHLRLAFKVLQNPASAWYCRPAATSTAGASGPSFIKQAVLMLFGAEVARQCQEVVISSEQLFHEPPTQSASLPTYFDAGTARFVFRASLPQPGADLSKLKIGGFISVDGRPLSSQTSGIAKKLLAIFHAQIGRSLAHHGPHPPKVHNVFIRLDIQCPVGSYDANVEASKTDVLFTDEKLVCDAFERLCASIYGDSMPQRQAQWGNTPPSTPQRSSCLSNFSRQEDARQHQAQVHHSEIPPDSSTSPLRLQTTSRGGTIPDKMASHHSHGQERSSQLGNVQPDTPTPAGQRPGLSNSPVAYDLIPARGGDRQGTPNSPIHIPVSSLLRRGRRHRLSARGPQTPPPSSAVRRPHDTASRRSYDNPSFAGRPGHESHDGLRQTTISFGEPPRTHQHPLRTDREQGPQINLPLPGTDGDSSKQRSSFVSATELCKQAQKPSPGQPQLPDNIHQGGTGTPLPTAPNATGHCTVSSLPPALVREEQETAGMRSMLAATGLAPGRAACRMQVDIEQLRRSAGRFIREMNAWEGDAEHLSPEMADFSDIKDRLRTAMTRWLKKTRAERGGAGGGPVQVELYLRRSLRKRMMRGVEV